MEDYQERRKIRQFFASRSVLAVLFVLVLLVGVASLRALARSWEANQERLQVQGRLQDVLREKSEVSEEAMQLKSAYGVEREARERLNLRKPGEEVVIIQDSVSATTSSSGESDGSWLGQMFRQVRRWFGDE